MTKTGNRKWVRWLVAALLVPAFLVIVVELVMWLFLPVGPEASFSYTLRQTEPGVEQEVVFARNQLGLRSLSWGEKKAPEKTLRILVVGGSSALCPMQNAARTWWGLLENELNTELAESEWKVEIGTNGWDGLESHVVLRQLRATYDRFSPDIVITCLGLEDHLRADVTTINNKPAEMVEFAKQEENIFSGRLPVSVTHATAVSQTYRRIRNSRMASAFDEFFGKAGGENPFEERIRKGRSVFGQRPVDDKIYQRGNRTAVFEALATDMYAWLKEKGALVVALGQPTLLHDRISPEDLAKCWMPVEVSGILVKRAGETGPFGLRLLPGDFRDELFKFNRINKTAVQANGGWYVPLENIPPNADLFIDDCALSDKGAELAAEYVSLQVKPLVKEIVARQ